MSLDLWGNEIPYNPFENFKVFEDHLTTLMKEQFEYVTPQKYIGDKPTGSKHIIDVCVDDVRVLISAKLQNTGGTAEEKIPYEQLMLQTACDRYGYEKAYIVCAGEAWTLLNYYLSQEYKSLMNTPKVKVIRYEDFIKEVI